MQRRPVVTEGATVHLDAEVLAACSASAKTLAVAAEAYFALNGVDPPNQQALVEAGLLYAPMTDVELAVAPDHGYMISALNPSCEGYETFVPAESDTLDTVTRDIADLCETDGRSMAVALEAYFAQNGVYPASEAELVTAGFLRSESSGFDLRDGQIISAACS